MTVHQIYLQQTRILNMSCRTFLLNHACTQLKYISSRSPLLERSIPSSFLRIAPIILGFLQRQITCGSMSNSAMSETSNISYSMISTVNQTSKRWIVDVTESFAEKTKTYSSSSLSPSLSLVSIFPILLLLRFLSKRFLNYVDLIIGSLFL